MATSSEVSAGQQATAVQFNNLRTDALSHASRHNPGADDALTQVPDHDHTGDTGDGGSLLSSFDGDQLDIDWDPSNYTPAATPAQADDVDDLAAHLYGIDQVLGDVTLSYESYYNGTESSRTSTSFGTADTFNFTPSADGDWLIMASWRTRQTGHTVYHGESRLLIDGTVVGHCKVLSGYNDDYRQSAVVHVESLTGGTECVVTLQFKSGNSSGTCYTGYVSMAALKLS